MWFAPNAAVTVAAKSLQKLSPKHRKPLMGNVIFTQRYACVGACRPCVQPSPLGLPTAVRFFVRRFG